MDPDHSLLLSYRISDVEVFDYQLVGLRTKFIRPSFLHFCNSAQRTQHEKMSKMLINHQSIRILDFNFSPI